MPTSTAPFDASGILGAASLAAGMNVQIPHDLAFAVPSNSSQAETTRPEPAQTKSGLYVVEGDAAERGEQLLNAVGVDVERFCGVLPTRREIIATAIVSLIFLLPNIFLTALIEKQVGNPPPVSPAPQMDFPQPAPQPKVVPFCAPRQERRAEMTRGAAEPRADDCDNGRRQAA